MGVVVAGTESGHRRLRAVVVGTGMIGRVHVRAAAAAGASVAVVGSSPERGAGAAQAWGVDSYQRFADALSDEGVDVIHVCTPNALHVEQTMAAIDAGKHVVCEKPIATRADEALAVTHAAQAACVLATVPFVYRYHPLVREIRARRLAGEFGTFTVIHGSYLQDWMSAADAYSWRVDSAQGGASRAFADIGSHWCDLVEWVSGIRFDSVLARMSIARSVRGGRGADDQPAITVDTEDVATVLLQSAEGALGSTVVSQVAPGRKNRLWFELDGLDASAVFDQENPESIWFGRVNESRMMVRDPEHGSAEQRRLSVLPAGHPQGYAQCFDAFVADAYRAIAGETPEGLPTFADGTRSARLVDAVLASHRTGQWTKVAS